MDLENYLAKPNKTIGEHAQELVEELNILYQYGYITDDKIYELTKKACELHDIGKANCEFQKRVQEEKIKLKFDAQKEVAHNVLSACMIDPALFESEQEYYKVLFAVLYHHNYGDVSEILREKAPLIKSLLMEFDSLGLKRKVLKKVNDLIEGMDIDAIRIKGLLHKCDYSASAGYQIEFSNDFLNQSLDKLMSDWKAVRPETEWNKLQQFCMEKTNDNIIAIAQTGMGKTEGGLHWIGNHKGFFILPLRTAINAIYDRVKNDLLKDENIKERVGILHSDSLDYYMKNIKEESEKLLDYEQRGKTLSLPLSISTLDQLFDFVLKYPAYELKLTTLAYSKVVIDEIQMYEPNLLAYLIQGLKMIHSMGGKIAILTATFPPFLKTLLSPIEFKEEIFIDELKRHNVKVRKCKLNAQEVADLYIENKKSGNSNKILVVCNTIKKAQQIYQELRAEGVTEIHILHSRFTRKDRAERETEILKFGKTFNQHGDIDKSSGIWISTSLVEASLDIDFDVLFTELKDLSSLFQRFGRCNRKGKKEVSRANCFVYTEIEASELQNGKKGFIDREIYQLSIEALERVSGILSEEEKMKLIEEHFTYEKLKNSNYIREYERVTDYLKALTVYDQQKEKINLRNILAEDVIPYPVFEEHIEEIREWERELQKHSDSELKRREFIDRILQYAVSVPVYVVKNYEKAVSDKLAIHYGGVHLGKYRSVKVIDCIYDEMGVQQIDFKEER